MKNLATILIVALLCYGNAFAQKTEISARLNSGLFSFSGESAESAEVINYNLNSEDGYTNNPYGSKAGLCYGLSGNVSRVTRSNLKLGIDLGYEVLRSKIDITGVWQYRGFINETVDASGQTFLNFHFINLYPSLGYRFATSQLNIDLEAGFDLGYCLQATEKGSATSDSRTYSTERDRKTIDTDIRPRIQIGLSKNKLGGYLAFAKGIKNYKSGFDGGTNEAYGNVLRVGLVYQVN